MPEQKQLKRLVAYKVRISDIVNNSLSSDEFFSGYIRLNGINISRINVIATVVHKSQSTNYANVVIDDGTGKILLRSFENKDIFSKVEIGDAILTIGRIREFNNEKYIVPEILNKINNFEWINLRRFELNRNNVVESVNNRKWNQDLIEEIITNADKEIYSIIKKLDNGDGVLIEEVIKNSDNNEAEGIINKLLANGDIFKIKPGKLKVLE